MSQRDIDQGKLQVAMLQEKLKTWDLLRHQVRLTPEELPMHGIRDEATFAKWTREVVNASVSRVGKLMDDFERKYPS